MSPRRGLAATATLLAFAGVAAGALAARAAAASPSLQGTVTWTTTAVYNKGVPGRDLTAGTETRTEREDGLEYELHFRDPRSADELRGVLEYLLVIPFVEESWGGLLVWRATGRVNGADYGFELRFVGATADECRYTFGVGA